MKLHGKDVQERIAHSSSDRTDQTSLPAMKSLRRIIWLGLLLTGSSLWAQVSVPREGDDKPKLDEEKEAPAANAEDKQLAATFLQKHRSDLVFVKSKEGTGSGFIALMRGKKVLITNAHVLAGLRNPSFVTLDGSPLQLGTATVSKDYDLATRVVLAGGTGMPLAAAVDDEVRIGDAVVVLGNANGAGVVTPLHGEVVGLGPDRMEVNAPFELGNSGSPIVHLRSGKVIGVASYAKLDTLLSGKEKLRRFGYRIDHATNWVLVVPSRFYSESDSAAKILTATLEIEDILSNFKSIRKQNWSRVYETPALRGALERYYYVAAQGTDYADPAALGLLAALREACKSDLTAAQNSFSYDFFKHQLAANELARNELIKELDKVLAP